MVCARGLLKSGANELVINIQELIRGLNGGECGSFHSCVLVCDMIVNTTKFTVPPEKRNEFLQTIGPLLEPIRNVKGCRDFSFYLDTADENSTLLVSEWETETDLNTYLGSNDFAILRGAITVLGVQSIDSKTKVTSQLNKPRND